MLLTNQMLDLILSVNLISCSWYATTVDLEHYLICKSEISKLFFACIHVKDFNFLLTQDDMYNNRNCYGIFTCTYIVFLLDLRLLSFPFSLTFSQYHFSCHIVILLSCVSSFFLFLFIISLTLSFFVFVYLLFLFYLFTHSIVCLFLEIL